jgi:hypothetical protein
MEPIANTTGYPLSYFANAAPFDRLLARFARYQRPLELETLKNPELREKQTSEPSAVPPWAHRVWLTRFSSMKLDAGPGREKSTHATALTGGYEYSLEFATDTQVRILLDHPRGVIALFGNRVEETQGVGSAGRIKRTTLAEKTWASKPRPAVETPAATDRAILSLRLRTDHRGRVNRVQVQGDVQFQLPRGLVSAVVKKNDKWLPAVVREVVVPLGEAQIQLERGEPPQLSQPLEFDADTIVRIGKTKVIARLGRLNLTGSTTHPKISFEQIELMTRRAFQDD